MDLSYHATILDFATHTVAPATHVFANGGKVQDFSTSGSATGVGDVSILAKYNLMRQGSTGVALAIDLTVPSGDDKNMLGSGATLTKIFLVASSGDKISPHINVGYTAAAGGTGAVGNQFNYTGGVEFAAAPRLTVVGDLIAEHFQTPTGSPRTRPRTRFSKAQRPRSNRRFCKASHRQRGV